MYMLAMKITTCTNRGNISYFTWKCVKYNDLTQVFGNGSAMLKSSLVLLDKETFEIEMAVLGYTLRSKKKGGGTNLLFLISQFSFDFFAFEPFIT